MEMKKPRQLYFKLFCTYTVIVCFIVISLSLCFLFMIRKNTLNDRERRAQETEREIREYIRDKAQAAELLQEELYRKDELIQDMLMYLAMEPDEYQGYKLNSFSASNSSRYQGTQSFIQDAFEKYPELEKIEVLGYEEDMMSVFYPRDIVYPYKNGSARAEEVKRGNGPAPANVLCFVKQLRDPDTMDEKGCIIFYFKCADYFGERLSGQEYADAAVAKGNDIVYESGTADLWERLAAGEKGGENTLSYSVFRESAEEYQIYMIVDQSKAAAVPPAKILVVTGMAAAVMTAGILCINAYIRRLTGRVEKIVRGMKRVREGDLTVKLNADSGGDELDMIAAGFNDMCGELQTWIQKNYLAEIEKKNASIQALQSQINPHFLYNTLEAIRMKAICNGDREVGKMLYSMSVLFRSQLKEDDWITIGQELDYCKQYFELFEYRYQNIFRYEIDCPVELLGTKVIKFILQPVVENYFIHGIRRQDTDNYIRIAVRQMKEKVIFCISDNGTGVKPDVLERKNAEFQRNEYAAGRNESIGLANVNRRIRAVYGEGFGVRLANKDAVTGTEVTLTVGVRFSALP